jgi:P27 family predicted phage terminase small subunit
MAPHPIPIELKRLRGNPGRRRLLDALAVAKLRAVPEPPNWMSSLAQQEWRRWAPALHQLGLLSELDLGCFSVLCVTHARWLECEMELESLRNDPARREVLAGPLGRLAAQCARDSIKFMAEFGMSPSQRCKVAATGAEDLGKFRGLLAGYDD